MRHMGHLTRTSLCLGPIPAWRNSTHTHWQQKQWPQQKTLHWGPKQSLNKGSRQSLVRTRREGERRGLGFKWPIMRVQLVFHDVTWPTWPDYVNWPTWPDDVNRPTWPNDVTWQRDWRREPSGLQRQFGRKLISISAFTVFFLNSVHTISPGHRVSWYTRGTGQGSLRRGTTGSGQTNKQTNKQTTTTTNKQLGAK